MERIGITEKLTYLVPSSAAQASFLNCCGLLVDDERKAIIDGNMGPSETPGMLEAERPDICVVSHFHVDHSRWAHEAARVPGVTVHVPRAEMTYLADVNHFVSRCGVPPDLSGAWRSWLLEFAGLRPVPEAVPLSPGEILDLGSTRIEVVDAPGHSPGHQGYWIAAERLLMCVDIGVDSFGPWYGWKDCDLEQYVRSIHRMIALDARVLVTGHGGVLTENIEATLRGCIEVLRSREKTLREEIERGDPVERIASRGHIYGDFSRFPAPLDRMYEIWEGNMIAEHARVLGLGGIDAITGF